MTLGVTVAAALLKNFRRRAGDGTQSKVARVFDLVANPFKATTRDRHNINQICAQVPSLSDDRRMLPIDDVSRSSELIHVLFFFRPFPSYPSCPSLPFLPFLHRGSVLCKRVVGIAVQPALAVLRGRHDRMAARLGVLRRMAIERGIAAMRAAAALAGAQVHPRRADLDAVVAHALFRAQHFLDRADVSAGSLGHLYPLSSSPRFQFASVTPASYVDCRNSISASCGDGAVRTSSYLGMNSLKSVL